jgi:hypothetical protein
MISGDCARLAARASQRTTPIYAILLLRMDAPLRVFSIEVVEAPSIALVVASRSCLVQPNLKS